MITFVSSPTDIRKYPLIICKSPQDSLQIPTNICKSPLILVKYSLKYTHQPYANINPSLILDPDIEIMEWNTIATYMLQRRNCLFVAITNYTLPSDHVCVDIVFSPMIPGSRIRLRINVTGGDW